MTYARETQIIAHLKTIRKSIDALLNDLQPDEPLSGGASLPSNDPKLNRLTELALRKIIRANGEWVNWTELRPAHRDRDSYSELVWIALAANPNIETRTSPNGIGFSGSARYEPLI